MKRNIAYITAFTIWLLPVFFINLSWFFIGWFPAIIIIGNAEDTYKAEKINKLKKQLETLTIKK